MLSFQHTIPSHYYDSVSEDFLYGRLLEHKVDPIEDDSYGPLIGRSLFAVLKIPKAFGIHPVAVKVIPYKDMNIPRKRMLQEIDTFARLGRGASRNILGFVGWFEDKDARWIGVITEVCENGNLADWIQRIRGSNVFTMASDRYKSYRSMVQGILSGVYFIHCKGFIHNDIKPTSILLSTYFEPVIGNFDHTTPTGEPIFGTHGYKCPESDLADEKSDAYGVGVTLHQMYSGNFHHAADPFGFDINPNTIPDAAVRQYVQALLVPRDQRMTVRELVDYFPSLEEDGDEELILSAHSIPTPDLAPEDLQALKDECEALEKEQAQEQEKLETFTSGGEEEEEVVQVAEVTVVASNQNAQTPDSLERVKEEEIVQVEDTLVPSNQGAEAPPKSPEQGVADVSLNRKVENPSIGHDESAKTSEKNSS